MGDVLHTLLLTALITFELLAKLVQELVRAATLRSA